MVDQFINIYTRSDPYTGVSAQCLCVCVYKKFCAVSSSFSFSQSHVENSFTHSCPCEKHFSDFQNAPNVQRLRIFGECNAKESSLSSQEIPCSKWTMKILFVYRFDIYIVYGLSCSSLCFSLSSSEIFCRSTVSASVLLPANTLYIYYTYM